MECRYAVVDLVQRAGVLELPSAAWLVIAIELPHRLHQPDCYPSLCQTLLQTWRYCWRISREKLCFSCLGLGFWLGGLCGLLPFVVVDVLRAVFYEMGLPLRDVDTQERRSISVMEL